MSRATLYRRIGTVDDIARLVLIREVHLFLDSLPESGQTAAGPKGIIDTAVAIVRHVTEHPVFIKIMDDEPELIRDGIRFSASIIDVAVDAVTPFIDQEMEAGRVRKAPTATTAKLLIHLIIAGIITQPRDLEGHFTELMGPVLEP